MKRREEIITARERVKRYEDAGINKNRYLELKYIARQYDTMCKEEAKLRRGEVDRPEGRNQTWKRPDPTGNAAVGIAIRSNAHKIRAIEDSAKAAGPEIYKYLLRCVTRGETFEKMVPRPPCGSAQFYRARRLFYVELDARLP